MAPKSPTGTTGSDWEIRALQIRPLNGYNNFVAGMARLLKPSGRASIEFPHLLRLQASNQFDTIYHEHYSYLSLRVVQRIVTAVGLAVVDVEELPIHGGSLRVWLTQSGCC